MQEELTEEFKAQLMPGVGIQISVSLKKHHRLKAEEKRENRKVSSFDDVKSLVKHPDIFEC